MQIPVISPVAWTGPADTILNAAQNICIYKMYIIKVRLVLPCKGLAHKPS